jgi:hypothetical protein
MPFCLANKALFNSVVVSAFFVLFTSLFLTGMDNISTFYNNKQHPSLGTQNHYLIVRVARLLVMNIPPSHPKKV